MNITAMTVSICVLLVGCRGDVGVSDSASSSTIPPTTTTRPFTTSSERPLSTTTTDQSATTTLAQATSTVSDEQLAKAASVGDIAVGEELFYMEMDEMPHDLSCSSCHSLDGVDGRSPSLLGISEVAADRIQGLSDIEYLRQSLSDPLSFVAGEWASTMPYQYGEILTDEQVNNLVAFLLTK